MTSTVILSDNGASSGSAGLKSTAGNDGVLILQTTTSGGTATNALYVDNKQVLGMGVTPSTTWDTSLVKVLQIADNGASIASYTSNNTLSKYMFLSANAVYDGVSGSGWKYLQTGYASQYTLQNYKHIWSSATTNTAGTAISWTQVMSVELNSTLALQGASTSAGTGITFPATQSASTDANTLDDYEEGTWTPTLTGATGSPSSYGNRGGQYTKVGRFVHVQAYMSVPNAGTMSGAIQITGLPFQTTSASGASQYFKGQCRVNSVTNLGAVGTGLLGVYTNMGSSAVNLEVGTSSGVQAFTAGMVTAGTDFMLDFSYETST